MALIGYFRNDDSVARAMAEAFIEEAGKAIQIDKLWSMRADRTHHNPREIHTHIMFRGKDVYVVNRDGTPSHNTNPSEVPTWVLKEVKKRGVIDEESMAEFATATLVPQSIIYAAITLVHAQ